MIHENVKILFIFGNYTYTDYDITAIYYSIYVFVLMYFIRVYIIKGINVLN